MPDLRHQHRRYKVNKVNDSLLLHASMIEVERAFLASNFFQREKWQAAALKSVASVISRYRADLELAIQSNQINEQKRIACVVSGARKGIPELGFLDKDVDHIMIALLDQLSTRALTLCLDTKPN